MEYTQWAMIAALISSIIGVLILVVMEYTQWGGIVDDISMNNSLNPCCNGIYSMRAKTYISFV